MICFPGEIDVPKQSDESNDQRSQQERSVVEVDQLTGRPNLKQKKYFVEKSQFKMQNRECKRTSSEI